jgi:hypothetical protein
MKLVAGAVVVVCAFTGSARADVVNGGFEAGDFRGWTITKTTTSPTAATVGLIAAGDSVQAGTPVYDFADHVNISNYSIGLPMVGAPTEGARQAYVLQNGPASIQIAQTVLIEAGAHLSWDLAYHSWSSFSPTQRVRVTLRSPDTDEVVATLADSQNGMPVAQEMTQFSIDLAAFQGRRVRLAFDILAYDDFLDVELDDVRLTSRMAPPDGVVPPEDAVDGAGSDDTVAAGGCSTTGGGAGLLLVAAAACTLRRRRR